MTFVKLGVVFILEFAIDDESSLSFSFSLSLSLSLSLARARAHWLRHAFDSHADAQVEKIFRGNLKSGKTAAKHSRCAINTHGQTYAIDVKGGVQKNLATGGTRRIRRAVMPVAYEYEDPPGSGKYTRYGAEAERSIEAARDRDICGRVTLQLGGTAASNMYAVDLNLMSQANVANGNSRSIRRRAPAAVWQFEDGKAKSNQWKAYDYRSAVSKSRVGQWLLFGAFANRVALLAGVQPDL